MTLRHKIFVFLFATIFLLISSILISYHFYQQKQLIRITNEIAEKRNITNTTFELLTESVKNIVIDYTFWDEMVENILIADTNWLYTNIEQLPTSAKLNYVWIYNLDKKLLSSTYDSSSRQIESPLPIDKIDEMFDVEENGKRRFCHFFIKDSANIVEIYGATVHKTNDFKKIHKANGFFFVGKIWDEEVFDKINVITKCNIVEINDSSTIDTYEKIIFFKSLYNYDQKQTVQMQLTSSTKILENENKYGLNSLLLYALIIIIVILVTLWFVTFYVLKPLKQISKALNNEESEVISKLSLNNDEFGKMAKLINDFFIQKHNLETEIEQRKIIQEELNFNNEELKEQKEEILQINEEYQQINEELNRSKIKAEESDQLKTAFLSNMSHEIRTPMNAILGFSQLLENPNVANEKKAKYIKTINDCGHQLMSIIDDLLDIAKIEANQIKIEIQPINLNEVLAQIHSILENKAKASNLEFNFSTGANDLQTNILTDGIRLRQILINLINNAIKFTPKGQVKFGYEIKENTIEFFVQDTGIGINKNQQQKVFERFVQVETELTKIVGGNGLGLSISKALVELLEGKIWLKSELGKGTTMFFTIPYKPSEKFVKQPQVVVKTINANRQYTVLVAEDEVANYFYLEELLTELNIIPLHALNGQFAVDMVAKNPEIDLILMDIKMPVLDGYEASEEIRKFRPDIPIIAQTAYLQLINGLKASDLGFDDFIFKPINPQILKEILQKYLL